MVKSKIADTTAVAHPNWSIRAVTVPGPDTDLSIFVNFDSARFLVGCGEGTQRAFVQNRLSFRGLQAIFLPSAESRTRNGLAGVLMTAADTGISNLEVIGPPDTAHQLATLRASVIREAFLVDTTSFPAGTSSEHARQVYESPLITVNAIALTPHNADSSSQSEKPHSELPPVASTSTIFKGITTQETIDELGFDPREQQFDASKLSKEHLARWRSKVAQDMFGFQSRSKLKGGRDINGLEVENQPRAIGRSSDRPPKVGESPDCSEGKVMGIDDATANLLQVEPDPETSILEQAEVISKSPDSVSTATHSFTDRQGRFRASYAILNRPLPLPSLEETSTDMVYIFQAPELRGKFDVKRAIELGVPNGPFRGRLVKGESIEVDDTGAPGGKRTVHPSDCLVGGGPGPALIIVTCTEKTMPALLASSAFKPYWAAESSSLLKAQAIVHRIPRSVWSNSQYREWMSKFGESTQHLIADPEEYSNETVFTSSAWNTLQLSMIDWNIFPYPWSAPNILGFEAAKPASLPSNVTFLKPGHTIRMHPAGPLQMTPPGPKDRPFPTSVEGAIEARETLTNEMKEYWRQCGESRKILSHQPWYYDPPKFPGSDITVTTLGTGSAIPSKYRNVSATHLDCPGQGGILLDCGEGTLGQLRRRFGPTDIKKIYENLKLIFVSHMHADHHLGLQAILEDRFKHGITSRLYIVGPPFVGLSMEESPNWQLPASEEALRNIFFLPNGSVWRTRQPSTSRSPSPSSVSEELPEDENMLEPGDDQEVPPISTRQDEAASDTVKDNHLAGPTDSSTQEAEPFRWRRVPWDNDRGMYVVQGLQNADIVRTGKELPSRFVPFSKVSADLKKDLALHDINVVPVEHRGKAYGLILKSKSPNGWKIVYSGDTKPCFELVKWGYKATLLIHEATLEDDKPEIAAYKGHSTFGQAIEMGRQMNAKHVLLNHFSQRYPKLPKLTPASPDPNSDGAEPIVSISFDLMSIKISEMWKMAYYMDPMAMLFAEPEDSDDVAGSITAEAEEQSLNEPSKGTASPAAVKPSKAPHASHQKKMKDKDEKSKKQARRDRAHSRENMDGSERGMKETGKRFESEKNGEMSPKSSKSPKKRSSTPPVPVTAKKIKSDDGKTDVLPPI